MNNPFHSKFRISRLMPIGVVLACFLLGGCAQILNTTGFFTSMRETFKSDYEVPDKKVELLKPVPKNQEAVHLEIFLVEKPMFNPLMGNKLWKEVDQIAGIDVMVRDTLKKNGFRIGRVGTRPPVALQSLLGMTSDFDETKPNSSKGMEGREIFVAPGSETILITGPTHKECQVHMENQDGAFVESFENANCVFRVQAERLQDGFANLKFIPEIQHGDKVYRHLASEDEWIGRTSQELLPFFRQQFELNLNIGEMAIITADLNQPDSLGRTFFVTDSPDKLPTQRLLVIRLAEMKKMIPLYPEQ